MAVVARKRGVALGDRRDYIALVGDVDGVNSTFSIPGGEKARFEGSIQPYVWNNGQRQEIGEDVVLSESGGAGTGFDTITFAAECIPRPGDKPRIDFLVA